MCFFEGTIVASMMVWAKGTKVSVHLLLRPVGFRGWICRPVDRWVDINGFLRKLDFLSDLITFD